jgi:cytidylate kinase
MERGEQVTFDETLKNVEYRDHIDTTREDSPLVKAKDAIEIDNSALTRKEQFEKVYKLALEIIGQD